MYYRKKMAHYSYTIAIAIFVGIALYIILQKWISRPARVTPKQIPYVPQCSCQECPPNRLGFIYQASDKDVGELFDHAQKLLDAVQTSSCLQAYKYWHEERAILMQAFTHEKQLKTCSEVRSQMLQKMNDYFTQQTSAASDYTTIKTTLDDLITDVLALSCKDGKVSAVKIIELIDKLIIIFCKQG